MAPGVKLHRAIYDLAIGPVSYDFATWLIAAEMERRQLGAERLHVVIRAARDGVDGWFRDKTSLYGAAEMHWRLWHLVLPLCHLVNASVELDPLSERGGRQTLSHHAGPIIAAARAGAAVPRFAAGEHARAAVRGHLVALGRPAVTMTLRDTYETGRNSDREAWREAAEAIRARGYAVIELEDSGLALGLGRGFYELDVELRMALYQEAALNLHSHGGPMVLSWYSDAPWIGFGAALPAADWKAHWEKHLCLKVGEQLPWARPDQRLVYESDSREVILREFERWAGATN